MFTGIIEDIGRITAIEKEATNLHLTIESRLTPTLKIDESVAHNGICLTVVAISGTTYTVTAIEETIQKTAIANYKVNDEVNLERAMILGARLDGHIVQGHIDTTATCLKVVNKNGSTEYTFQYPNSFRSLVIEKGSICVNGTSLTAFHCQDNLFTVAIIPYTLEHTTIKHLEPGTKVNIEFDLIGKYILRNQEISAS